MRRLRTLTVGFLTPFYFLRAGTLVSLPALLGAPLVFLALLAGKVASKIFGLYPVIGVFRRDRNERWYYTLLMSTGLTFGTISSLYGLTQEQYSFLVAAVIASAVVPTVIAGLFFVPTHLLPERERPVGTRRINGLSDEG
jgi:Kef-type K+ transport system membrane component KefB